MIGARDGEGGGRAGSGQGAEHTGAQGEAKVIGARGGGRVGRAGPGQSAEHAGARGETKVIGARLGEGVGRKRVKDVLGTPPRGAPNAKAVVGSCALVYASGHCTGGDHTSKCQSGMQNGPHHQARGLTLSRCACTNDQTSAVVRCACTRRGG